MRLTDHILKLVYPPRCPCCGELTADGLPCGDCLAGLEECEFTGKVCRKCGLEKGNCECRRFNYLFSGICAPFKNTGTAREGVYSLKFGNFPDSAGYFGHKIAERFRKCFPDVKPDLVCIVPSHRKTLAKRNYDYVALLAKAAAKELKAPLKTGTIKKIRMNERQHTLNIEQRRANVKGIFRVNKDLTGKTVLLIDDIKTTGCTLNECAKQLRLSGAERVYCAVALITLNNACNEEKIKI